MNTPNLVVTIPTESIFNTSSYVNVPPIDTLPEKVPVDATTDPTVILGVPERPVALPFTLPAVSYTHLTLPTSDLV